MNRKLIFKNLHNYLTSHIDGYDSKVVGDQLIVYRKIRGVDYSLKFRCQNFGDTYLVNSIGVLIKIDEIEQVFRSLVIKELQEYYSDEFTLALSAYEFDLKSMINNFKIKSEIDLKTLNGLLVEFILEVQDSIFDAMTDVKSIAKYISKYNYDDNLKVLVGGSFPVHNFKKIFLLFAGDEMDKYIEYKEGVLEQIESFPLRKPNRKEEARLFIENYDYLITKLEARDRIKPIA